MSVLGPVLAVYEQMFGTMGAWKLARSRTPGPACARLRTHSSMSPSTVSPPPSWAHIIQIRLAVDRLEAECLRRLHRFHADRGAQSDSGGTTVSWLRRSCGMTAKAAAYRVHLARTLGEMPAMLDSARTGRASFTNVAMVGHLAGAVGVEAVQGFEDTLLPAAEALDPGRMRRATEATRLRIDPDGVLADANHDHAQRWLDCDETYGGVFVVR